MSVKETTTSQWGYLGVQNLSWEKSLGTRNGCPNPYSKISVTKQTNSHVMQHCHAITMHGFVAFRFDSNRNIHVVFPRVENGSIFEYITMSTIICTEQSQSKLRQHSNFKKACNCICPQI